MAHKVIRSTPTTSLYKDKSVIRTRSGRFNADANSFAVKDRQAVGKVRMRYDSGSTSYGTSYQTGGYTYKGNHYPHAKREYSSSNFQLISRGHNGRHKINRHYLNDYGGRWGRCPDRYNGRNYHFYISLVNNNYYFGLGYSSWNRRHYGDGWDMYFGWNSGYYIPQSYWSYGTYYYEPCYAFSFTFNHGYERGYIDGYTRGVNDWNNNFPYNSYPGYSTGYASHLGSYSEYADGYQQGFAQGYYAGYSGQSYGYMNFGFGDFSNYPVIYDFDYDYYNRTSYYDDGYEYTDYYGDYDYYQEQNYSDSDYYYNY
jgi:hypothetical protein